MGGVQNKIDENTIIQYLEQFNEASGTTKIKVRMCFLKKHFSFKGRINLIRMMMMICFLDFLK